MISIKFNTIMNKKLISFFATFYCTMFLSVYAATYSGSCGEALQWTFQTETGVLDITGSGKMTDYALNNPVAPWYSYRSSITSVNLPKGLTSIGACAFVHCTGLTSISIPKSVTTICGGAFYECTALSSVSIPNSVTSIGWSAFLGCSALTSISIPNSVTTIERAAFSKCSGLTSVSIPNSITSIGQEVFANCTNLISVSIPTSVTKIGTSAFWGCSALASVLIPEAVTSIGAGAFYECTSLISATIPSTITTIETGAFYRVPNIIYSGMASGSPWKARSVNGFVDGQLVYKDDSKTQLLACSSSANGGISIPNTVTSIGEVAFWKCTGLTSITCEAINPPKCAYESDYEFEVFYDVDKSIPLYVHASSIGAYQLADQWKDFSNIKAIPGTDMYSSIGDNEDNHAKKIVNGTFYILRNGKTYTLHGQEVK